MNFIAVIASMLSLFAEDRSTFYPPSQPIWGVNTVINQPAVLWYEGNKLYNSNPYSPEARDHYDVISWEGSWLVYRETTQVGGISVKYPYGIRYVPKTANGSWTGYSPVSVLRNGHVVCSGVISYATTANDFIFTLHSYTRWLSGSDPSGCHAGYTTEWYEWYQLGYISGIPSLVHSRGGNTSGADNWDIVFTRIGP